MKTRIFAAILFFSSAVALAQIDTNIIKYLPLKIGNVWVYNYTGVPASGQTRISITGTTVSNGHTYYLFQQTGGKCTCAQSTYSPFIDSLKPMRIDSLSGDIMFLGANTSCLWHSGEMLLDSMKTRIGDINNNSCNSTFCMDTNQLNIFGQLRQTKYVGANIGQYSRLRRYARGIGLVSSYMGCSFGYSCNYTLAGCEINGAVYGDTAFPTGISQISSEIPESFSLSQNYPNPFNPDTKIKFQIANSGNVKLTVYDGIGKEVTTLFNQQLQPGTYETEWDASNYTSGVYFYKLTVSSEQLTKYTETKKLVLIK